MNRSKKYFVGIKNRNIYEQITETKYRNTTTGVEGEMDANTANKWLKENKGLSKVISLNPTISELISKLKLIENGI